MSESAEVRGRTGVSALEPRRLGKAVAESLLVRSGLCGIMRRRHRNDAVILAYHNVIPDDAPAVGDQSLHIRRASFARQLDCLARTHAIVPLGAILDENSTATANVQAPTATPAVSGAGARRPHGAGAADPSRPRAAITFDDAYRGAMTLGLGELRARGLPATLFVSPGLLGDRGTWWDLLADPGSGEVPAEARSRYLSDMRGVRRSILDGRDHVAARTARLPSFAGIVTEAELSELAGSRGLAIASHSWSHANLAMLDEDRLEEELVRAREWLEAAISKVEPWVAYPYGLSSTRVEAAAARSYDAGFRLDGGYVSRSLSASTRHSIPRINIPAGVSIRGFELRTSGMIRR